MKALAYLALLLPIAAHAEKCPEVNGRGPKLAAEAESYKFFYFTEAFGGDGQQGALYVSRNGELFSFEVVDGHRDRLADLTVSGDVSGLSVDSVNYEFTSAWITENGARKTLRQGRAYLPTCEQ